MSGDAANSGDLTRQLAEVQRRDEAAIAALWDRYYPQLARLADQRLNSLGVRQRAFDGDDVAASAMGSFFKAVEQNRFPDLHDEESLLRLLRKMTIRKVIDRKRKTEALKAGGGDLCGESAFGNPNNSPHAGIDARSGPSPAPDWIVLMDEECQRLFELLGDEELRIVARLRMEGHSNADIAAARDCSVATVERRLKSIRELWSH
jgi:DNA-directed RNA polymerase specialized sigma24 family protein